ncbi:MAG: EAL domain-containing protein [Deltaproteobacteria bacterium]|nr:EAL domain-containing protein [Deltaproteobacteria bacterium]MDQ3295640.1 EAL domain-containing protein [Myxococcota bacterium]
MTTETPARVLVVDDDESLLHILARRFTRMGHAVECARDGKAAILALATGTFDVVVSDIAMPGMDGIELLIAIRAVDPDVPIVLMTGAPQVATAARAIEFGAVRYLTKPVPSDQLGGVVAQAVTSGRAARIQRETVALAGHVKTQLVGARTMLEAQFANAIETLWMAYQPIFSWSTKQTYAYEALVRNGEPALASPLALFEAAESLGRVHALGRAIRRVVAAGASSTGCKLFVNLHAHDLSDPELFSPEAPLSRVASQVVLEITEREALDQIPDVQAHVGALRSLGYQIAIDDLGAGYAGLTSVAQLRPDIVKIDMSLVRGVDHDPIKQILVKMMLGVAREMGMVVVAEGIETASERAMLVTLGCDLMQGYLFAKAGRAFPAVTVEGE